MESASSPHYRETDEPGSDFRSARQRLDVIVKRSSTRVLLIIGSSVISILMAATAYMVGRDRNLIDRDIEGLRARANVNMNAIGDHSLQLATIRVNQEAFARELLDMKKVNDENQVLLRTVLVEVRRR